jgi:hypothetical protein
LGGAAIQPPPTLSLCEKGSLEAEDFLPHDVKEKQPDTISVFTKDDKVICYTFPEINIDVQDIFTDI